jgi:hypothetical protein
MENSSGSEDVGADQSRYEEGFTIYIKPLHSSCVSQQSHKGQERRDRKNNGRTSPICVDILSSI